MEFHSLHSERLVELLDRVRKFEVDHYETYLRSLFLNVLSELSEFVPAEGIFVLLDDPAQKRTQKAERELTYVAVSGKDGEPLLGKRVPSTSGIIGETYTLGKSTVRKVSAKEKIIVDKVNFPKEVNSLICASLKIENTPIGTLLLYNKKDPVGFTIRDLKLVEIFAGYISTSVQNAIDARKSKELSKRDDLTGLYNDRHFHKQLELEIKKADETQLPLCLLFIDLDHFKSVNDTHGHLIGSQTLREVGFILVEAVDVPQATLARYGGDEYVVILPNIDLEKAVKIGDRFRNMIKNKLFMIYQGEDGSFINFKGLISASIGVGSLHDHLPTGGSIKERKNLLMRLADTAMYKAKEEGKNCVCIANPSTLPH